MSELKRAFEKASAQELTPCVPSAFFFVSDGTLGEMEEIACSLDMVGNGQESLVPSDA